MQLSWAKNPPLRCQNSENLSLQFIFVSLSFPHKKSVLPRQHAPTIDIILEKEATFSPKSASHQKHTE